MKPSSLAFPFYWLVNIVISFNPPANESVLHLVSCLDLQSVSVFLIYFSCCLENSLQDWEGTMLSGFHYLNRKVIINLNQIQTDFMHNLHNMRIYRSTVGKKTKDWNKFSFLIGGKILRDMDSTRCFEVLIIVVIKFSRWSHHTQMLHTMPRTPPHAHTHHYTSSSSLNCSHRAS